MVALAPADVMGLTGVSFTASVGSIDPTDQVMGLTGQSASFSVGAVNVIAYAILTRAQIRLIVMFQRVRILLIRMLQLAQIQAITT